MKNSGSSRTSFNAASSVATNGLHVLVIPGFLNNDAYMRPLHDKLTAHGLQVHGWAYGINLGPSQKAADHLETRLKQLYEESGRQKVSLIGYSQGGIYARELARKYPELVRCVITLASPFGMNDTRVTKVYSLFQPTQKDSPPKDIMITPPPVFTVSIYSKNDGVVNWRSCLNAPSPFARDIQVQSGHLRLPFDEETFKVIAESLHHKLAPVNQSMSQNVSKAVKPRK